MRSGYTGTYPLPGLRPHDAGREPRPPPSLPPGPPLPPRAVRFGKNGPLPEGRPQNPPKTARQVRRFSAPCRRPAAFSRRRGFARAERSARFFVPGPQTEETPRVSHAFACAFPAARRGWRSRPSSRRNSCRNRIRSPRPKRNGGNGRKDIPPQGQESQKQQPSAWHYLLLASRGRACPFPREAILARMKIIFK